MNKQGITLTEEGRRTIGVRQFYDSLPTFIQPLQKAVPPYMPYEKGHGYMGVMLLDTSSDRVQCHVCGWWYKSLSSHLKTHGTNAREYKKEVGLYQSEALMSLRTKFLFQRKNSRKSRRNLPGHGDIVRRKAEGAVTNGSETMQWKNRYGTCDAQLKFRLDTAIAKYGRVPTTAEEPRLAWVLKARHGTWEQALEKYGLKPFGRQGERIDPKSEIAEAPQCQVCLKPILRTRRKDGKIEGKKKWKEKKTCSRECYHAFLLARYPVQACKVAGCGEKYSARGYCNIHYLKFIKGKRSR